ncbi:MAG: hypothetical protein PHE43_02215 [Candidatus Nanoarchaeia archaeon]|nr:hypothetical protein [Candidatus Nanoarchaeia archaeon]
MNKILAILAIFLVGFSGVVLAWNQPSKDTTFVNLGNVYQEKVAKPMSGWSNPYYHTTYALDGKTIVDGFEKIFKDAKYTVLPKYKTGAINVAKAYGETSYGGADCTEVQGDGTMSGTCSFRMVVAPGDCTEEGVEASVEVPIKDTKGKMKRTISVRHLDGLTDDSFEIYLAYDYNKETGEYNKKWLVGTYEDNELGTETWITSSWTLPITCDAEFGSEACFAYKYLSLKNAPKATIIIEATGDLWAYCNTYGQLAISSIALN